MVEVCAMIFGLLMHILPGGLVRPGAVNTVQFCKRGTNRGVEAGSVMLPPCQVQRNARIHYRILATAFQSWILASYLYPGMQFAERTEAILNKPPAWWQLRSGITWIGSGTASSLPWE